MLAIAELDPLRDEAIEYAAALLKANVSVSWPAIYATAIITAQYIWNDFFWPNLYITSPSKMVAALGLVTLQNAYQSGPVGAIFAGLSILVIPVAVFFVFVQRQLMEGLGFAGISR